MLSFDPSSRISVPDALLHPWLASYHDVNDEPECVEPFVKWHEIEKLETLEQFREAIWKEIEDYRKEVRGMGIEVDYLGNCAGELRKRSVERREGHVAPDSPEMAPGSLDAIHEPAADPEAEPSAVTEQTDFLGTLGVGAIPEIVASTIRTDPVVTYARRSSLMVPSRQNSTFSSPMVPQKNLPSFTDGPVHAEPGTVVGSGPVAFPSHGRAESYILPARSRTSSTQGGEVSRKLLRTLSTVSIHESIEGLPGGLSGVAEIREYVGKQTTEADAPPSEIPREFGFDGGDEDGGNDNKPGKKEGSKFQIE
jgi:mitogen-activated protein kinase 7